MSVANKPLSPQFLFVAKFRTDDFLKKKTNSFSLQGYPNKMLFKVNFHPQIST